MLWIICLEWSTRIDQWFSCCYQLINSKCNKSTVVLLWNSSIFQCFFFLCIYFQILFTIIYYIHEVNVIIVLALSSSTWMFGDGGGEFNWFYNGIWFPSHSPHHPIAAPTLYLQYRIDSRICIENIDFRRRNRPKSRCHQSGMLK